ncbi:hypothetical protein C2845_PM12G10400 [Panicum miliaceum]|uniref:Protein YABBY 5-like n=1 Tax=Panicum miliaceum TaxID=4540 RepID=A0A3L6QIB7_PANMI|nr:hypothetical protein C2845_PM12G10400 [Panicum miliaceum]
MSSSSSAAFPMDHLAPSPTEQLCYVHCNCCDTILAVGVPCSSLFKTVTVRCGHCANLLSVNLRGLLLPPAAPPANQLSFGGGHSLPSPTSPHGLLDEFALQAPSLLMDQSSANLSSTTITGRSNSSSCASNLPTAPMPTAKPPVQQEPEMPKSAPSVNRPPEKRQRVPSAYNRFIKDEIQRIKAGNPDITHREAFSAAAKNWAHFPHIHFGLMPDQGLKKTFKTQDGAEDMLLKDGLYAAAAAAAAAANMGITPF